MQGHRPLCGRVTTSQTPHLPGWVSVSSSVPQGGGWMRMPVPSLLTAPPLPPTSMQGERLHHANLPSWCFASTFHGQCGPGLVILSHSPLSLLLLYPAPSSRFWSASPGGLITGGNPPRVFQMAPGHPTSYNPRTWLRPHIRSCDRRTVLGESLSSSRRV